jgi:murein DD-endopeptidase MepM/ murein hydrolase activator NlpD
MEDTSARKREFQLVVRNAQNYDEVGTYALTATNVYLLVSTVFVVVAAIVVVLIAFTPLRRYLPGYTNQVEREELADLELTLAELTDLVDGQNLYIENLKRTVRGEATTADSIDESNSGEAVSGVPPLPPSEAEIALRRELEEERAGAVREQRATLPPSPGSNEISLAQVYLVTPVNGEVSAGFNPANGHMGVDVLAPRNTPVKATRGGVVFMSEFTPTNGNVIGIQHDNNLVSFYKHNERLLKEVGDRVAAGEAVAIIGNTGTQSTGPHLHFELWYDGRVVDPGEYVSF